MKTTRLIQFVITAMTACTLAFTAQAARGYNQYKYEDPTKHGGQYIPLTNEFVEVKQSGEFGTMYNPYALPTTLPHWLSNLCMHHLVTNAAGHSTLYVWNDKLAEHHKWGEVEYQGYRKGKFSTAWFLGTNTFYTENSPIGGENDDGSSVDTDGPYYKKVRLAQFQKTKLTEDKDTCLAQIKKAAEALTPAKGSDEEVGKNVTIAICELLMPHESTTTTVSDKCLNGATTPFAHANCTVISNLFYQLGYRHETTQNSCWENGQRLDGMSMAEVSKLCSEAFEEYKDTARGPQFNGYWYANNKLRPCNWSPEECISKVSEHYETGIDACIARLEPIMASEWDGKYLLAASTNETAKAAKMEWPMFDDDVYLDRGDIGMMLFACKAVKTLDYMAQAYEIAGASSKPYSAEDPSYKDQAWTNRQQIIKWQGSWRESIRHRTWLKKDLTTYYNWRFERATCTFFHDTSSLLNSIKDPAMAAKAHQLFKEALAVYLDADAYIFGRKSATGHTIVGQRDNSTLHLFELFENDEDDEERGEKNAAGWRLLAEKAYESLNNDSTATIDLVDLGKKLNIHTKKNGAIDFSGLGEKADGKVTFNANMITNLTRHLVTDVNACVTTNGNYALYAAHQIGDRWYPPEYHYWDGEATNYVKNSGGHNIPNPNVPTRTNRVSYTVFNLSKDTIDPTLGGVYPSCAFLRDIATMQARYPSAVPQEDLEDNVRTQQEFSRHLGTVTPCEIVTVRKEIAAGSTEELEDGKTYTAAATDKNGGVFKVGKGATLIGTNATFADNSAAKGGAIYNEGEVVMKGTFTLETAGDTIQNNGVLNWNLTGGNAGMLEGYDQLVNEGTLLVSIDDQTVAPVTIAKGDFANVDGKDTFTITNVTTDASVTLKIGEGFCLIGDKYCSLSVVGDELKLIMANPVKLSNVEIVDKTTEPWTTNATATVYVNDTQVTPNEDGSYTVPDGTPIKITYTATENALFGSCLKEKDLWFIDGISEDHAMTDDDKKSITDVITEAWVNGEEGREITLDTRERIVVSDLNDILPIAYSTNCWDKYPEANWARIYTNKTASGRFWLSKRENGYAEWFPQAGAYGKYDFAQKWSYLAASGAPESVCGTTNATVWYGQDYQFVFDEDQKIYIERPGDEHGLGNLEDVTSYTILNLKATPEYTNVDRYEFVTWKAYSYAERDGWKNSEECPLLAAQFGDITAAETTFEMPFTNVFLTCTYQWKSNYTDTVTVEPGIYNAWEIHEGEKYEKGIETKAGSIVSFRGIVNPGTLNLADGATNIWDYTKGALPYLEDFRSISAVAGAVNMILFDETLENDTYQLADCASESVGQTFLISNGSSTKEITVVTRDARETTPWTYIGAKRFKLYYATSGYLCLLVETGILQNIVIANDFSANPPFENWDPVTGTFTWNGQVWTNGVNAFTSFTDLFTNDTYAAGATNISVFGCQTIAVEPVTDMPWTLNLIAYEDAAGNDVTPIITVDKDIESGELIDITKALEKPGITGTGAFVLGKQDADKTIYNDFFEDPDNFSVANVGIEPEKKDKDVKVEVDKSAKVEETEEGEPAIVLPGTENLEGDITIVVSDKDQNTATNDVLIAGKTDAPNGKVTISNETTNEVVVAGEVNAAEVEINNTGKTYEAEGAIVAEAPIKVTGDVTINNQAHLEANVVAGGTLTITNGSEKTLVGTYEGVEIVLTGDSSGALSNVTFTSDGPVMLMGQNVITGPFTIDAPAGAVTNFGTLAWNVRGTNHVAKLKPFDAIVQEYGSMLVVHVDAQQEVGEYVLAENAYSADGQTFLLVAPETWDITVNGDPVVVVANKRWYSLRTNESGQLVLTVIDLRTHFMDTQYEVVEGGAVKVYVWGGSLEKAVQATVSAQRNTSLSLSAYMDGKSVSFPLTLNWAKGDLSAREIVFRTTALNSSSDRFFTLQLGSKVGEDTLKDNDVCTVRIIASKTGTMTRYARALAWPANAGTVSGAGSLSKKNSTRTLTAKAKNGSTFSGWFHAQADNKEAIDFNSPVEPYDLKHPERIRVGYDDADTYFAYFTDELQVASVDEPTPFDGEQKMLPGVAGVIGWNVDSCIYYTMVGVKFSLPVSFTDDSENGKLSVSKLPSGLSLKRNKAGEYSIIGVPTKAGSYNARFVASNAAGQHTVTYAFEVAEIPTVAVGTFAGVISDDTNRTGVGSVQFTAGKTGSLSAKVTRRLSGTRSFSVKGYDYIDENTLGIAMTNGNSEVFEAALATTNSWHDTVVAGRAFGGVKRGTLGYNEETNGVFAAIRTAFSRSDKGSDWYANAQQILQAYRGNYSAALYSSDEAEEVGSVKYRIGDNGSAYVVARLNKIDDGVESVSARTFSGTVAGGFICTETGIGGCIAALRNGSRLWSTEVMFDISDRSAAGKARYIRPSADAAEDPVDADEKVLSDPK